ncbi:MAG: hypothetical protein ACXWER_05875 [Halobacteriota archaeon]
MVTIEKLKELFGELPKDVQQDPYYRKGFLDIYVDLVKHRGEQWVKDHRVLLLSQWDYVRTLV